MRGHPPLAGPHILGYGHGDQAARRREAGVRPVSAVQRHRGTGARPQDVDVHRIPGVAPSEAVQTDGFVFVRNSSRLPAKVQALVHAPECTSQTSGAVVAVWGGVDSKYRPTFDGDIGQPPYGLELFVRSGPPRLRRAQISARVSDSTDGVLLTPVDVRHVLWTGGTLSLDLGCSPDGQYRVLRIGNRVLGAQ